MDGFLKQDFVWLSSPLSMLRNASDAADGRGEATGGCSMSLLSTWSTMVVFLTRKEGGGGKIVLDLWWLDQLL